MPTATWKSRLRSGSAHCDLQLAVEVRQCPLGSGARGGGPAVPTGIWTARRRPRRRWRRRMRRRRRRTALIKSNNRHLAGGEKQSSYSGWIGLRFLCGSTSLILTFSESTQLQEATTLTEQCVDVSASSRSCPDRQDHTPYTPFIPSLRGQGSQNFTVVYPFWL